MAKKKFKVRWAETAYHSAEVEANNKTEAENMFYNGEINADADMDKTEHTANSLEIEEADKMREKLIERIMSDIEANLVNYADFVLDCVKDRVENWEDEELRNWVGE